MKQFFFTLCSDSTVKPTFEYFYRDTIALILLDMIRRDGEGNESAAKRLLDACNNPGKEIAVDIRFGKYHPAMQLDGWHFRLKISGECGEILMYDDDVILRRDDDDPLYMHVYAPGGEITDAKVPYGTVNLMTIIAKIFEYAEQSASTDESKETPSGELPETPGEAPELPKYVQMVHHEEPVIHPPLPKKLAPLPEVPDAGEAVTPETTETTETPRPGHEENPAPYPVSPEQVYRTAAIALSKLDLTAIIKAQRVMFPDSKYWADITRARLYEELTEELMKECAFMVAMIRQGNGPSLDTNPMPMGTDREKRPFHLHAFVTTEGGPGQRTYSYSIAYMPVTATAKIEDI